MARSLQVLVSALCLLILFAATPHMASILLLLLKLAAFNGPRGTQGASDRARELSVSLLLTIIHEHLFIEFTQLHNLVDGVSLI